MRAIRNLPARRPDDDNTGPVCLLYPVHIVDRRVVGQEFRWIEKMPERGIAPGGDQPVFRADMPEPHCFRWEGGNDVSVVDDAVDGNGA